MAREKIFKYKIKIWLIFTIISFLIPLGTAPWTNKVMFGLPFFILWIALWAVIPSLYMYIIYKLFIEG